MDINKIFSENLREQIHKSGKNQSQVAADLGVSRGTMSDWCTGKIVPRMAKVEMIANYFGIQKSDLLEEKTEGNSYYLNIEVKELAQELFDNPEARALFSASRRLKKEDIQTVKALIDRLTVD